jgi:phosphatidylglycerol:prolipoprotein diacylglycerol transferase
MDVPAQPAPGSAYALLMLGAIVVTAAIWFRRFRKSRDLPLIYIGGLAGAFVGAKIVYLLAEGWLHFGAPDMWMQLATGKTVVGALLGGYAGVEVSKRLVGVRETTGDFFAFLVPPALIVGRLGCLLHGCCPGNVCEPAWFTMEDAAGVARWPAVPVEMLFNLVALAVLLTLRKIPSLHGQLFHLYLIAYGIFRFAHEFVRGTPKILGSLSGYHLAALALVVLGVWRFRVRARLAPPLARPE